MRPLFRFSILILLLVPAIVLAVPCDFVLKNSAKCPLGQVTLHYPGGSTTIMVLSPGNWTTDVPANVTGITINGQRSDAPVNREISLTTQSKVKVIWKTASLVEIIDIATQGIEY